MPVPRFFFILWVCVPCLFVDDAVRMTVMADDTVVAKTSYCQILEERKARNLTVFLSEELRHLMFCDSFFQGDIVLDLLFDLPVPAWDTALRSFSRDSVGVQQFTSRRKPDSPLLDLFGHPVPFFEEDFFLPTFRLSAVSPAILSTVPLIAFPRFRFTNPRVFSIPITVLLRTFPQEFRDPNVPPTTSSSCMTFP